MNFRRLVFFALLPLFPGSVHAASAKWEIRTLAGRDYIPLPQVAGFYQMRLVPRAEGVVALVSESRRMDFRSGSREARIDGVKHWLSYPVLSFGGRLYLSRMDLSKTIHPAMVPQKVPEMQPVRAVLLDPGHGGHDRGAVNRFGSEKNYNLAIALEVQRRLREANLRTELTRSTDRFIPLEERPAMAKKLGPGTIFVSIHCNYANSYPSPATGYEIYSLTPRGAPNSNDTFLTRLSFSAESGHRYDSANQALSASIYHAMLGRLPMFDRGMKRARFAVLRRGIVPGVLVECGFVSNPRDAQLLNDTAWRKRLADSIARGIIEYCNLTRAGTSPKLLAQYRREEAAALAGTKFDYQPLEGIGAAVQTGFASVRGWRGLLSVPLGVGAAPFHLEFEPCGWVELEAMAAAGEDARSMGDDGQDSSMDHPEWPGLAPAVGGERGWRSLLPPRGQEGGFELFQGESGPINAAHGEMTEISGGSL